MFQIFLRLFMLDLSSWYYVESLSAFDELLFNKTYDPTLRPFNGGKHWIIYNVSLGVIQNKGGIYLNICVWDPTEETRVYYKTAVKLTLLPSSPTCCLQDPRRREMTMISLCISFDSTLHIICLTLSFPSFHNAWIYFW